MSRVRKNGGGRKGAGRKSTRGRRSTGTITGRLAGLLGLFTVAISGVALGIGIGSGVITFDDDPAVDSIGPAVDRPSPYTGSNQVVEVQVLNGGGVSGMAGLATEALRRDSFDVVEFGNASGFDPERPSVVFSRAGNPSMAWAVADSLGIDNVLSEPDPNLYVDVTVVLGSEWTEPSEQAPEGARRSWDPRSWFGG
jgi:hypothetical protein